MGTNKKKPVVPGRKRGNPNLQRGVQPEWLKQMGFDGHPEHINRYGTAGDISSLRKIVQKMGNEAVEVQVTDKNGKKKIIMLSRFERILLDWFSSQQFDKQQAAIQYGAGKVPDKLEVTDRKTIRVTIEKKEG